MTNVYTINSDRSTTVDANTADTKYVVAEGVNISVLFVDAIDASSTAHNREFEINGHLAGGVGLEFAKGNAFASGGHIVVGSSGSIDAGSVGISAWANDLVIVNHGEITAANGIDARGKDLSVTNTGTIHSAVADGISFGGSDAVAINSGSIFAMYGVRMEAAPGETVTFHNTGVVKATSFAVLGYYGNDVVINQGKIAGLVDLSYGSDTYDGKGGVVHGLIDGGQGADVLKGGNAIDNLSGGMGDDLLTGRGRGDVFVFSSKFDADTITDFQATGKGHDTVDLSGMAGFQSFADLAGNMHENGKDAVLDFGHGDVLTLHNVDFHDLSKADFLF